MTRLVPSFVNAQRRWLLLNHAEMYVMRLHVVGVLAAACLPLGWLAGETVRITEDGVPDPEVYFIFLLLASASASLYWVYVQVRLRGMMAFRSGLSGFGWQLAFILLLVAINGAPFVFTRTLSERIASFAMQDLDASREEIVRYYFSYERDPNTRVAEAGRKVRDRFGQQAFLVQRVLENRVIYSDSTPIAVMAVIATEVAAGLLLIGSLGLARVAGSLAVLLAFGGLVLVVQQLLGFSEAALLLTCLLAAAICCAGFIVANIRLHISRLTAFTVVGFVGSLPLIPLLCSFGYYDISGMGGFRRPYLDSAVLLFAGTALLILLSPLLHYALNRFQAAPR